MTTPTLAPASDVGQAVDTAVDRIRRRTRGTSEGFQALGEAIGRAAASGKRFRPALVVASFHAFGGHADGVPALLPVAAAFELLHTAFVVHDDVIDHDTMRRGVPNVSGEFRHRARLAGAEHAGAALLGDAAGILAGDLLLHEATRLIALAPASPDARERLLALLDDAVFVSAAGELADVENAVAADLADAAAILGVAHDKTAVYSFTAPLRAGAVLAEADDDAHAALELAGGRLGLAYQLVDDLLGAFGTLAQTGREPGGDLREAKRTPLIALARQSDSWPRVQDALALAHTGPVAVRDAQRALERSGARVLLLELLDQTLDAVRAAAADPPLPTAAARLLGELADGIRERVP